MKKPSGAEFGRGLLGHAPVALEHVRAASPRSRRSRPAAAARRSPDRRCARSTPGSGKPTVPGDAVAVIGVRGVHVGLGHAVALEDGVTGRLARPFAMRLGEQRRRARDEQPHVRVDGLASGRDAAGGACRRSARPSSHVARGMSRITSSASNFGRKIIDAAGHQRDVDRHEQAVGMIDRQRVEQHVLAGEAPGSRAASRAFEARLSCVSIAPLERPGRAGRVEDRGEIVGRARNVGEARRRRGRGQSISVPSPVRHRASRHRLHAALRARGRDRLALAGLADHKARLGVADEIIELGGRIGGVERQIDRAGPQRSRDRAARLRAIFSTCTATRSPGATPRAHQHIRQLRRSASSSRHRYSVRAVGRLDEACPRSRGDARADAGRTDSSGLPGLLLWTERLTSAGGAGGRAEPLDRAGGDHARRWFGEGLVVLLDVVEVVEVIDHQPVRLRRPFSETSPRPVDALEPRAVAEMEARHRIDRLAAPASWPSRK